MRDKVSSVYGVKGDLFVSQITLRDRQKRECLPIGLQPEHEVAMERKLSRVKEFYATSVSASVLKNAAVLRYTASMRKEQTFTS